MVIKLNLFLKYLKIKRQERVLIGSENGFTGFDNLVQVDGNRVFLLYKPEDLIILSEIIHKLAFLEL